MNSTLSVNSGHCLVVCLGGVEDKEMNMKKIRKHALTTAIAATLAGGMSSLASAQPVVGILLHAPTVGDVLAVGLLGDTGLVDLNVAGN